MHVKSLFGHEHSATCLTNETWEIIIMITILILMFCLLFCIQSAICHQHCNLLENYASVGFLHLLTTQTGTFVEVV